MPEGIHYVANLVMEAIKSYVQITEWHYTHNNDFWIVKPDASCGIEICSPVLKGWSGIKEVCRVIQKLSQDKKIKIDESCALHVHVEVADCDQDMRGSILAYWIKCEAVFIDSVPKHRKLNRFCQIISLHDIFEHDTPVDPESLIEQLGKHKYFTLNTYHLSRDRRETIEFRIVEQEGCINQELTQNWIRLLVHFVEMTKKRPLPYNYVPGDPWSSLLWLDPNDVMSLLGFLGEYDLSRGLRQTRKWFLKRLFQNSSGVEFPKVLSDRARRISKEQVTQIIEDLNLSFE